MDAFDNAKEMARYRAANRKGLISYLSGDTMSLKNDGPVVVMIEDVGEVCAVDEALKERGIERVLAITHYSQISYGQRIFDEGQVDILLVHLALGSLLDVSKVKLLMFSRESMTEADKAQLKNKPRHLSAEEAKNLKTIPMKVIKADDWTSVLRRSQDFL